MHVSALGLTQFHDVTGTRAQVSTPRRPGWLGLTGGAGRLWATEANRPIAAHKAIAALEDIPDEWGMALLSPIEPVPR